MQVLKKITPRAVFGKLSIVEVTANWEKTKQPMPLFNLYGMAEKIITRESPYPDEEGNKLSKGFKGTFKATNLQTGEVFIAPVLFAPTVVSATLEMGLKQEGVKNLEFGFLVGVRPSERDANKYEYTVVPLVEAAIADPLAELTSRIEQAMLPAPSKATKK